MPREADITAYPTYRSPGDFDVDWPAFYREADRRAAALRDRVRHERHVLYGDHPYRLLNLYYPPRGAAAAPVFVFAHGGAFREGHPDHYDSLAAPFLRHGVIFVSMGYRLAPEATIPEAIDDGAAVLAWLYRHAAARGGDPGRLYMGGHSAGGLITASLAVRDDWQAGAGVPVDIIKGAVSVSGVFDVAARSGPPVPPAAADRLDPIKHVHRWPPHTIIAFGPSEANRKGGPRDLYRQQGERWAEALRRAGAPCEVLRLAGADHPGTARMVGEEDSPLFRAILAMMTGPCAGAGVTEPPR